MVAILNPDTDPAWTGYPIVTSEHGNGNASRYVEINGTFYHANTPKPVVDTLESARNARTRLTLYYGKDGQEWGGRGETGRISRSMGPIRIPILIKTARSMGGCAVLDDCIVRITDATGRVRYQHPDYQPNGDVEYFASLEKWSAIARAIPRTEANDLWEDVADNILRARGRGVQSCKMWFSATDKPVIDEIAAKLDIHLTVRR